MTSGLQFWDISIWSLLLAFAGIFLASLLANALIQTIRPLKRALIPSPVLGGFLLLIFLTVYKAITGVPLIEESVLEIITYHTLGIGFVAGALKFNKNKKKTTQKAIINSSFFTIGGYALQAVVGVTITVVLFFIMNAWPSGGVLLPMGYGQGPGQAFNWGNIFSQYTLDDSAFGAFEGGVDFGLSIAAMGFISASIGGVIYLNIERRKGNFKMQKDEEYQERLALEDYESEGEIASSDSIDKMTIQFGIVLVIYAVSFALLYGLSALFDLSGVGLLVNTLKPVFWGFNFIFGVAVASIYKLIYTKLKDKGVIKKQYTNNYTMDRISGLSFDIMVVAAFASINLESFLEPKLIVPLILVCVAGGVVTYFYCQHVSRKVFPEYKDEAFLAFYGMLTGTNATGIILLREIDPQFETPACDNMVFQSLYSIAIGAPILLSLGSVGKGWTQLIVCLAIYIVLFAVLYILMRRDIIFKKKQTEVQETKQE
ncbi:hypothetical protein J6Y73_00005 [bacterium]|nr:hypothetical protein [bacterium]